MGLGVHCTGDFINPGYRGHMPLQLFNAGPTAIRIFPYLPICQLVVIKLTGDPTRVYGQEELHSKYMHDNGGPSYWWRDKRIKSLQKKLREIDVTLDIQERVLEKIAPEEPEVQERFEEFVSKSKSDILGSCDTLLNAFFRHERLLEIRDLLLRGLMLVPLPILGGTTVRRLIDPSPFGITGWVLVGLTLASLAPWGYVICTPRTKYATGLPKAGGIG